LVLEIGSFDLQKMAAFVYAKWVLIVWGQEWIILMSSFLGFFVWVDALNVYFLG